MPQGALVVCGGVYGRVVALLEKTTQVVFEDRQRVREGDVVELAVERTPAPVWRSGTVVGPTGALLSEVRVESQPAPTYVKQWNPRFRTGVAAVDVCIAPSFKNSVLALLDTRTALSGFIESVIAQQHLDGVRVVRLHAARPEAPLAQAGATTVVFHARSVEGLPFAVETVCTLAREESDAGHDVLIVVDDFENWRADSDALASCHHLARSKPLADLFGACRRSIEGGSAGPGHVALLCATVNEGAPSIGFDQVWNLQSIELPGGLQRWLRSQRREVPYRTAGILVGFGGHRSLGKSLMWRYATGETNPFSAWLMARGVRHIPPLQLVLAAIRAVHTSMPASAAEMDAWVVEAEVRLMATLPEVVAEVAKFRRVRNQTQAVFDLVQRMVEKEQEPAIPPEGPTARLLSWLRRART